MRISVIPLLKSGASFQRDIKIEQQVGFFGSVGRVGLEDAPYLIVAGKVVLIEMDDFSNQIMGGSEECLCQ